MTENDAAREAALFQSAVGDPAKWPLILTSRYFEPKVRDGVNRGELTAVGITLGYPRGRLGYKLEANWRLLAPTRNILAIRERATFEPLMMGRLVTTWPEVEQRLIDLGSAWDRPIVLLCYEDLTKPGEWCHRRIVAQFIYNMTGEEIHEL